MAEKEIILRESDVSAFVGSFGVVPGDPIFNGLVTVYKFGALMDQGDEKSAKALAYENRADLGSLWRRIKENESAQKTLKPWVEKIAEAVPMPDVFKWQVGAKKVVKTVTDVNELWKRLEAEGVTLEAFLNICKVDFGDAVELSGKNESAFLEAWGDVANVETKQNKNTLKGL